MHNGVDELVDIRAGGQLEQGAKNRAEHDDDKYRNQDVGVAMPAGTDAGIML